MANLTDSIIIEDKETLEKTISEIKSNCENGEPLAVGCEGVSLSRKGELTILNVATKGKVYIFDVLRLGKIIFDKGMREILQERRTEKLTFDCREDCDSLWHNFDVKLEGVLDLQLLEVIHRWNSNPNATAMEAGKGNRRSELLDEVEDLYGYRHCIELYIENKTMIQCRKEVIGKLRFDNNLWKKRPLSKDLIEYCCVDTHGLFSLYEKLKDDEELPRLRMASERYADTLRQLPSRSFDHFEHNSYLPIDIIPHKGTLDFPFGTTSCTTCHRKFPQEEFTKGQLRRRKQKCRVCKKMTHREKVNF